jgi:hypothetical protein
MTPEGKMSPPAKAKECEVFAHVRVKTGEIVYLYGPGESREDAEEGLQFSRPEAPERVVRVRVIPIE